MVVVVVVAMAAWLVDMSSKKKQESKCRLSMRLVGFGHLCCGQEQGMDCFEIILVYKFFNINISKKKYISGPPVSGPGT